MKSLKAFIIGIIIGLILNLVILNLVDYPFWHEVGIGSIMPIIFMILYRDKF